MDKADGSLQTAHPVILAVDTAGPVVGAALWSDGHVVEAWSERVIRGADGVLSPAVAHLLALADDPSGPTGGRSVTRLGVAAGPGGFTGLRVGLATVLGVAWTRSVPVVPVSSLAARANLIKAPRVLALLDARKGRLYAGLFDTLGSTPVPIGPLMDVEPSAAMPEAPFVAVGEGTQVARAAIEAAGGTVAPNATMCAAGSLAQLTAEVVGTPGDGSGSILNPEEVALHYLRRPDAKTLAERGIVTGKKHR